MHDTQNTFDFLRVSIETRFAGPFVVAVTSALADDGAPMVAAGLAEAFADAGHATALVAAKPRPAGVHQSRRANLTKWTGAQLLADVRGGAAALSGAVAALRENYAVVIVDAEPLPASSVSYELAREADAVLVAIRLGRKPAREDRLTMTLLDDAKANVLGVVPTNGRPHVARAPQSPALESPSAAEVEPYTLRTRKVEVGG